MCNYACATLSNAVSLVLLDLDSEAGDGFDEMVVIEAAMRAFNLLRELREAQGDVRRLQ